MSTGELLDGVEFVTIAKNKACANGIIKLCVNVEQLCDFTPRSIGELFTGMNKLMQIILQNNSILMSFAKQVRDDMLIYKFKISLKMNDAFSDLLIETLEAQNAMLIKITNVLEFVHSKLDISKDEVVQVTQAILPVAQTYFSHLQAMVKFGQLFVQSKYNKHLD